MRERERGREGEGRKGGREGGREGGEGREIRKSVSKLGDRNTATLYIAHCH